MMGGFFGASGWRIALLACLATLPPVGLRAAATPPQAAAAQAQPAPAQPAPAPSKSAPPASTAAAGPTVFPAAIAAKYASRKAGDARMHTCVDQYHANKATNGNGGMRWIQKGGGYYSACLKTLKAAPAGTGMAHPSKAPQR